MPKRKIPVVKPLAAPEPCVIDELPEVVTVVDDIGVIHCGPTATLASRGDRDIFETSSCRWEIAEWVSANAIRYVAGVE
jgi:hypothetical protein